MNSKGSMNYSCLFSSLPAISCNFIYFFCTDPCASRDLIEQITESSELDFLEIFPLQKQVSKCQIHLKLAIIMIRLKSAILKNASKVFFSLSLRASGMMLSLQMARSLISQPTANFSDVIV